MLFKLFRQLHSIRHWLIVKILMQHLMLLLQYTEFKFYKQELLLLNFNRHLHRRHLIDSLKNHLLSLHQHLI